MADTVSSVAVTPSTAGNAVPVATYDATESDVTKKIQRIAINDSLGDDLSGTITDAAAVQTDGTALSWTSIFKQISKSVQAATAALAAALAVKLQDGAGNAIGSTGGALNANITNIQGSGRKAVGQSASVCDAAQNYNTVAASQAAQALTGGTGGAIGDYLESLLIVPADTSPGAVTIQDGGGAAITLFAGGASSVSNLAPIPVPVGAVSINGAWKVTTGAGVSVIALGSFS